jgi:hypothetical protein
LVLSPWILGFSGETTAMLSAVIIGAGLVAASLGMVFVPRAWEEWTEAGLGLLLIVSPWALRYGASQAATANAFLLGFVILGLSGWVLMTDKDWGWLRDGLKH